MKSQVYVIGATDSPVAKIGVSTDPVRRLRQIQSMSPLRLEILWTCPGGYPLEGHLHTQLRAYRSHGEWFDFQDLDPVKAVQDAVSKAPGGEAEGAAEAAQADPHTRNTVPGCICGHGSGLHGLSGCTVMGWDEATDCRCTAYTPASDETLTSTFDPNGEREPAPLTPSHPLALSIDTRVRLGQAVRELLNHPGLVDAPDPLRLAVLVLAAHASWATGAVEVTSRHLGEWLGLSVSHMQSVVLPGLRRSGVVTTTTLTGEFGEHRDLQCEVLPLRTAQGVSGQPLALSHKELTAWLRLMKALMAPSQPLLDAMPNPAGLLSSRAGRGSSTDRLALLLLVLEAAETGRVRLCGGTVDKHRGRAAATVARLLDCGLPGAERVLKRLEDADLVRRTRRKTASGLHHRTRLVVPSVAAAHRKSVERSGTAAAPRCSI
ncbi:GIY-YIG nuclease family protein [Streptomyces stelliscabiei]|uniref:GIY-YIG nuclease family protein n=1 Tax=Streptomyces stelliscabiei TaxID=146820 RepID=UPI0029A66C43|nr:GIY-YIG nuclease family protein [Streptomyces stelliscabiei]MDX2521603.1 GIY-YIG nuclease family protein [Streptomyces stelliscabiei]